MKLRIRSGGGRTEKVDFDGDPTVAEVKESVAQAFGHHAADFELSLNGREALAPDSSLSHVGIVSGDLLRIIWTNEGAVEIRIPQDQASGSQTCGAVETARGSKPDSVESAMEVSSSSQDRTHPDRARQTVPLVSHDRTSQPSAPTTTTGDAPDLSGCRAAAKDEGEDMRRSVSEPMLCRSATDCVIPQRLRALYTENRPRTMNEALCIVLHVLMLETGFYAKVKVESGDGSLTGSTIDGSPGTSSEKQLKTSSKDDAASSVAKAGMPAGWRVAGVHKLHYCHPSCEGAVCSIACLSVGKKTIVHGLTAGKANFTLQLKPSNYVANVGEQPAYTNLPQLSRLFKDVIAYPLLQTTRSELGLVPLHGLLALFPEIQLLILSFLDVGSLLNVSEVCRQLYNMAADGSLWRQLLLRDFGSKESEGSRNWRELYKQRYKRKKELERYQRNLIDRSTPVTPGMFYPPPSRPPTVPGYPPGYRGGDYDLDPFAGLAPAHHFPIRRDPRGMPFPGQPNIVPFPEEPMSRDPILNPLPRVPGLRDPRRNGQSGRSGGSNRGFYF
ncbi:F-box only protein 7-like [Acanthaster planci]|uniref:F-box only protein 7-like n=1 Tax=Acanthaster planci TaxID=133434 RepID=A0A8B7XJT6_ACAPL|nr:F-box only protein 7-like [Acanthaster planci]